MGASSVTGVSGVGSAEKLGMKGPGNMRNEYVPQVCPHVVAAGNAEIAIATVTVTFPEHLALPAASYAVLVTALDPAVGATSVAVTNNGAGLFESFTVTSAGAGTISWVVVTTGFGLAS